MSRTKPPKLDLVGLARVLGPPLKEIVVHGDDRDVELLDRMDTAYTAEHARWEWRHRNFGDAQRYEIVHNTSPHNDLISEDHQEIITLTQRECRNSSTAEAWCNTFAGRAAIRAALKAAAK